MASHKLTYFDGKGRGELSRMCFVAADKKFTDERIAFGDEWTKMKPQMPQGSMPVLTISSGKKGEDITLCQSMSVARYLAREFKLYGKTNIEMAYIDMILDTLLDVFTPFVTIAFMPEGDDKVKKMAEFKKDKQPVILGYLENILKKNPSKSGFAVGDKLSVADLGLFVYLEGIGCKDAKSGLPPMLAANVAKTCAEPKIKKYLASRKETPF